MRLRAGILLTLVALLVPISVASAAPADEQTTERPVMRGCAGNWQERDGCRFRYGGGGFGVNMSFMGDPVGAGIVRLEVKRPNGRRLVILQCGAAGPFGSCGSAMSTTNDEFPKIKRGARLFCIVEGRAAQGIYGCSSG